MQIDNSLGYRELFDNLQVVAQEQKDKFDKLKKDYDELRKDHEGLLKEHGDLVVIIVKLLKEASPEINFDDIKTPDVSSDEDELKEKMLNSIITE